MRIATRHLVAARRETFAASAPWEKLSRASPKVWSGSNWLGFVMSCRVVVMVSVHRCLRLAILLPRMGRQVITSDCQLWIAVHAVHL